MPALCLHYVVTISIPSTKLLGRFHLENRWLGLHVCWKRPFRPSRSLCSVVTPVWTPSSIPWENGDTLGHEKCVWWILGRYPMARSLLKLILLEDGALPLTQFILDGNTVTFPMKLSIYGWIWILKTPGTEALSLCNGQDFLFTSRVGHYPKNLWWTSLISLQRTFSHLRTYYGPLAQLTRIVILIRVVEKSCSMCTPTSMLEYIIVIILMVSLFW